MSGVRVFGIGSPSGDDQAGWLTVDALRAMGVDAAVEKLDRPGANLVNHLVNHFGNHLGNAAWVILVDAMQSHGPPGKIRHFDQTDWAGYGQGLSSHGFGVFDALSLARELGSLPPRIDVYGIEMGEVLPGGQPGESVQAAARQLARHIAEELSLASNA